MTVFDSLDNPEIAVLLRGGAVGVIPTDTIYGLAALAVNKQAVEKLYRLKQRPDEVRSGTVIAANIAQLIELGLDEALVRQAARFWPNPLSIELPLTPALSHLSQSGLHRAFRVVADPRLQAFLLQTGPLVTSSANISGATPSSTLEQAEGYFDDKVDLYVQGGDLSNRPPSTVATLVDGKLVVVRPGAVTINSKGEIA